MSICPFTNEPCLSPKIIHLDNMQLHVCEKCVNQYCILNPKIESNSMASKIISRIISYLKKEKNVKKCPKCGITTEEIKDTGQLGCAECYDYYKCSIEHVLINFHGDTVHRGKSPKHLTEEKILGIKEDIRNLKTKMKKAISIENYEVAGVLKIKIQDLEEKIKNDS